MKRLEKDIERLVHNKILGLISPEEEAMLEAWLNMSDKHRDSLKEMEDTALLAQRYKHYASIDNEKAWEEFTKKTGIEHTPLHTHSKSIRKKTFFKYAAIFALIIVGASILWYLQYTKVTAPEISPEVKLAMQQSRESGKTYAKIEKLSANVFPQSNEGTIVEGEETLSSTSQSNVGNSEDGKNVAEQDAQISSMGITAMTKEQLLNACRITTRHDKEFWLTLDDGTLVHMNYNTRLIYPEQFGRSDRNVILDGEAYFMVARDKSRPFIVHTPQGSVKVYGTEFVVNTKATENGNWKTEDNKDASSFHTSVVLVKGSVSVTPTHGKEHMMNPGQLARINAQKSQFDVENVDVTPFVSWNTGVLVFENCTLEHLMNSLKKWYGIKHVYYKDSSIQQLHFTGNLKRYGSIDRILQAIMLSCNVIIEQNGEDIIIHQ